MAMNYEYERHILAAKSAGNKNGVKLLEAQRNIFNSFVEAGIIQELPRKIPETPVLFSTPIEHHIAKRDELSRYNTVGIDGQRIKSRRDELGITQAGLASAVSKISRGYISIIERRDYARVSRATAERLSQALGIPVEEFIKTPIGAVVRAWREERGISVTELAKRGGITKGYISELEHDKIHMPNEERLQVIANALGIPFLAIQNRQLPSESSTEGSSPSSL